MESEEEALFRSYPYALYFVQSPSTISHANSNTLNNLINNNDELQSYDRESNNSFSHNNNNNLLVKKFDQNVELLQNDKNGLDVDDVLSVEDDRRYGNYYGRGGDWRNYFSFSYSDSVWWICLQLSWRLLLSLIIALVVFYVATKPPAPNVSIKLQFPAFLKAYYSDPEDLLTVKMGRVRQFRLGEGVDGSGVTTKILSFNCSVHLIIDNKSKLFGLHIHPPTVTMLFAHLPIAVSQGTEMYAEDDDTTLFKLRLGTRNKPMYGAGRTMQDLLESEKGLPLIIRVSFRSSFQVIRGVIKQKYRHEVQCLLILGNEYDRKHRTQTYRATC